MLNSIFFVCNPFLLNLIMIQSKPLLIGHRGSGTDASKNSEKYTENTICSFKQAIDNGADGVEFDVHVLRDGMVVVFHNFTIMHDGKQKFLHEMTYSQFIAAANALLDNSPEDKKSQPFSFKLDSVLQILIPKKIIINIELKYPDQSVIDNIKPTHVLSHDKYITSILSTPGVLCPSLLFSSFDLELLLRFKSHVGSYFKLNLLYLRDLKFSGSLSDLLVKDSFNNVSFCQAIEKSISNKFLGVVLNIDSITENMQLLLDFIASFRLKVFFYGEKLNMPDFVKEFSKIKVGGIIVDDVESAKKSLE